MGDSGPEAPQFRQAEAVSGFAKSELFDRTFHEGMSLVEETAAYLDGAGRQDSKLLSPDERAPAPVPLPAPLAELVGRSERLFERVRHLDSRMYAPPLGDEPQHPVLSQIERLKDAFGG